MTRLCLIGNSHLGAFRRGCDDAVLATLGVEPVFYGSIRDSLKFVRVRDGRIEPTIDRVRDSFRRTSGGSDSIEPGAFDAFVLVGLSASMKRVNRLYRGYRWHGQATAEGTRLLRRQVAVAALAGAFAETRLAVLARLIRGLSDRPIYAFAEPYWSDRVLDTDKDARFWRPAATTGDAGGLAGLFAEALQQALFPEAVFVPQPSATVSGHIFTAGRFSEPGEGEDAGDFAHMGAGYGRACWTDLLGKMGLGKPATRQVRAA